MCHLVLPLFFVCFVALRRMCSSSVRVFSRAAMGHYVWKQYSVFCLLGSNHEEHCLQRRCLCIPSVLCKARCVVVFRKTYYKIVGVVFKVRIYNVPGTSCQSAHVSACFTDNSNAVGCLSFRSSPLRLLLQNLLAAFIWTPVVH